MDIGEEFNYINVSLNGCKQLCTHVHQDICNSITYSRPDQTCKVSLYHHNLTRKATLVSSPGSVYLARERCPGISVDIYV